VACCSARRESLLIGEYARLGCTGSDAVELASLGGAAVFAATARRSGLEPRVLCGACTVQGVLGEQEQEVRHRCASEQRDVVHG
jgi:hypothetical protein